MGDLYDHGLSIFGSQVTLKIIDLNKFKSINILTLSRLIVTSSAKNAKPKFLIIKKPK
jgi:hypothetical protein